MEITGKIIALSEVKEGVSKKTGNKYMLLEFVVETLEQYPRKAQFTLFGEEKIKQYALACGDNVTVNFSVSATESKGRWYNSLNVSSVQKNAERVEEPAPAPVPSPTDNTGSEDSIDDLPF